MDRGHYPEEIDVSPSRPKGDAATTVGVIFALLAMMFAFFAFIMAAQADSKGSGVPAGAAQVGLSEFAITPASIQVPLNGKLLVTNSGSVVHNFHVDKTDVHTSDLQSGDSATVDLKGIK